MGKISLIAVVLSSLFQTGGAQVHASYDKFKDTTTVTTDAVHVGGLMKLQAIYTCPGNVPNCKTNSVGLMFLEENTSWEFMTGSQSVILLVNKARLPLGDFHWSGFTKNDGVVEFMIVEIPASQFDTIARATSVEGQVGTATFTLPTEAMQVLREMLNGIEPATVVPQTQPQSKPWCWHIDRTKC